MMTEHSTYVRRYLASHATEGGVLEETLDAEKLPYLDAVRLSELLRFTQILPHSPLWGLLSAWRSIKHRWSWDDPSANAAALDVALRASGMPPPERHRIGIIWRPRWAEWMTGGTVVGSAEGPKPRSAFGAVGDRPMLAGSRGSEVWIWDAATGRLLGEPLRAPDLIEGVATGGDDRSSVVAINRVGLVTVWNAATRVESQQFVLQDNGFRGVTTGRLHGRWVVVTAGATDRVYTRWMDSGEEALPPFWTAEMVRSLSLAETEDGTLAAVGHSDGTVALWNLDAQELLSYPINLGGEVNAVTVRDFSNFDTLVAAGNSQGQVGVWEAYSGGLVGPLWEHPEEVRAVALSMVGKEPMLAAGCRDGAVLVGHVGDPRFGTLPHPTEVTTVEFGDVDGRTVVSTTCADGNTRLWDPAPPSGVRIPVAGRVGDIAIIERDDGGIEVLTGNDRAKLQWWSGNGRRRLEVDVTGSGPVRREKGRGPSAAVAADYIDGRLTVLTSYLGNVQLWHLDPKPQESAVLLKEHKSDLADWRPASVYVGRGRALFVAGANPAEGLRVVDAFTGGKQRLKPLRRDNVSVLGFHAGFERVWLARTSSSHVTLDDVAGGGPLGPPLPTIGSPSSVALGKLNGEEALAVLTNGEVRLWDPRSGEELMKPIMTSASASGITWACLGDRDVLLTRHFATVRAWNPHTGRKLTELPFGTSIDAMVVRSGADGMASVVIGGPGIVFTELHERLPQRWLRT